MNEYYIVEFKTSEKSRFCIWYTNDVDGFVAEAQKVICFNSLQELKAFCCQAGYVLSKDITVYNVDCITDWIKTKNKVVDCSKLLDFWNITSDFARSTNQAFYGDTDGLVLDVYNKLFFGTNPPTLKGVAENYTPDWDEEDLNVLKKVMGECIEILI